MKFSKAMLVAAIVCAMGASSVFAQQLQQPNSVRPVALNYGYYDQDDEVASDAALEASPSDEAVADIVASYDVYEVEDEDSCPPWTLFPETYSGIKFGGWLQAGYHNKATPQSSARGDLLAFNDAPDNLNIHQLWFFAEKEADGSDCNWDWGFRTDMVYGTDAQKTQAFGGTDWDNDWDNGLYGWAMPQAYVELAKGNLSIKAGRFFTIVGYEVVPATGNFFYSRSLTAFNTEPFTHTGVLATYSMSDNLEIYGGWTAGWDTGFERVNNGSSFLGGFAYSWGDAYTLSYILTGGNFGARGDDAYSHSIVFDVQLSDNLNYVIQSDLLSIGSTGEDDIGINQYLFYTLNECWAVGTRAEWWRDEGVSNNEVTFGLNYKPHTNVVVRPEVRHDWIPANGFSQTTLGIDAIFTF